MSLVLDASVALAWVLPDEDNPLAHDAFEIIRGDGGWTSGLWRLEVANGLQSATRRRRIDAAFRDSALADLVELPISIDSETDAHAWLETLVLADRFGITLYDACYLDLAQRRRLPLATLDTDLRRAGAALGIEVLGD
jgi:predicted nucleic acid-binding protein